MIHDEKPSLEELTIQHFGVLGMKWGIRKHYTGGEIRTARRSATRTKLAVEDAKAQVRAGTASKELLSQAKAAHLRNPDRATAARITRGEMAVTAILLTPVTTTALVTRSQLRSRAIENRQRINYYDRYDRYHANREAQRAARQPN